MGQTLNGLIQPFQQSAQDPSSFSVNLCQGLYDADFLPAYNGPVVSVVIPTAPVALSQPTYAAHFYDPATGKNWLGSSTWTALSQVQKLFWKSLEAYLAGDMPTAGYNLGLALHYFTDVGQPMHAANFTFLSSWFPGLHTGFESWVMEHQSLVSPPTQYVASSLSNDPSEHLINNANNSKSKYFDAITPGSLASNFNPITGLSSSQKSTLTPYLSPILTDVITLTSEFLVAWMSTAQSELANCQIVSANSALVIDIPNSQSGAQVQQCGWSNNQAQRFTLVAIPQQPLPQRYKVISQYTTYVLDTQGSTLDNAPVVQNPYNGSASQMWQIVEVDDATVSLQNVASNLLLTVSPPLQEAGSLLVQGTPENTGAQLWLLTPASPVWIQLVQNVSQTTYMCDVFHAGTNPGVQVQVYHANQTNAQTFLWVVLGGDDSGYFMILNQCAGMVIVGASGQVFQDVWADSDAAKWMAIPGPGSQDVCIVNKASGGTSTPRPLPIGRPSPCRPRSFHPG